MGRGKSLSDYDKSQIPAKKEQGPPNRRIARDLDRCNTVVDNFVRSPAEYGTIGPKEVRDVYLNLWKVTSYGF
ncbi:unnamed protein product [Haemonchus placei]|uniref:HTH_Tnp_Tc3_1 domain-containing protein n=1 Tax=Haemonchus placei TaxID=6290 RepID=A0A0N4XC30_HAEPC|nr:unnamed protein product [Haemonchus placei]